MSMKLLLYSGLLYLITIAIVLATQPKLMFTAEGIWKEFGIGRPGDKYTWMPFWLFAILSAILCYLIVLICAGSLPGVATEVVIEQPTVLPNNSGRKAKISQDMKSGYYILNAEETAKKGIAKYTYLGPEPPNLIYNHGED